VFAAKDFSKRPKFYALIEFPYPSGEGLHVGHPRSYTAMDIIARKRRMEGYNVLYPIGFDSFGLPTENYAIKTGRPPAEITKENIATFTKQLKMLGFSFDWSRAVTTSDPSYYKWTQWLFLQFFKHGLAYKKKMAINWCPKDKIGLANEEVVDGACERCGTPVEKREKEQWMLAITKYADKLLEGLKEVDYIERAKVQQENWIGRKEGINIEYQVIGSDKKIVCFTTRPDTNFGATFVVLGPEYPFALELSTPEYKKEVKAYIEGAKKTAEAERLVEGREKTGVFTGAYCVNNLNGEKMPIWISDYVLGYVGTGAVVGVPGHDIRDFEFAKKFKIQIKRVVVGSDGDTLEITKSEQVQEEKGTMINSGFLDGMDIHAATKKIMDYLEEKGWGKRVVNYKLRDWVFSRQRYWGEPIPLVFCEACKGKKQKVLLIHGFEGSAESNWFPWMKQELEKQGFEVFLPTLPNSSHPKFEEWMAALEPIAKRFGEDDIIVGHSLGGRSALHLLSRLKKRIGHVYLIAPAVWAKPLNWNEVKKDPNWEGSDVDTFHMFHDHAVSWEDAGQYANSKTVIFSPDDPFIPTQDHSTIPQGWCINVFSGSYGHFDRPEYPELLELVAVSKSSGWIPLPEDQLPLTLPEVEKHQPTDTGESPLAAMTEWVKTKCPQCGGEARRETDTMPNWAGSSWYFLRYCDPHNDKEFTAMDKLKYWMGGGGSDHVTHARDMVTKSCGGGVDWYNGGMEHTVLHLLYSRFWNQFLYDIGLVPTREPYKKRTSHGLILAEDGEKMSKSRGNVVNPNEIVEKYGADVLRVYEMFMGPFDQAVPWSTKSIAGVQRFLEKVWQLASRLDQNKQIPQSKQLERLVHKTTKKVTEDIEAMKFNTAIAVMMTLMNELSSQSTVHPSTKAELGTGLRSTQYETLLQLLHPFAPHMTEELWERLHNPSQPPLNLRRGDVGLLCQQPWPKWNPELVKDEEIELVIQVNGRVRDRVSAPADISHDQAEVLAFQNKKAAKWFHGKEVKDVVFVKGKLINIVTAN